MKIRTPLRGKHSRQPEARRSPTAEARANPLPIGLEASVERVVEHRHTIQAVDPNLPAVFSTPAMIGLMEYASVMAVRGELPPGVITVGPRIEVDHLKAVTLGATVRARAQLVGREGRFLVFEVEARSGPRVIGRGRVFRAIVEPSKFTGAAHQGSR